ncbi:MAG: uracil-DNA glycosylase [Gammaproteobacteria bacterium]|nr:uracil-DNA glycosylase [Gammaproteobacteria bacterium]MCP5196577.1 uracil-DNA glycosylase [Gammaproteobacteria bacterium]
MTDKRFYLEALGIPLWLPRPNHPSLTREGHTDDHSPRPLMEEASEVRASDSPPPPAAKRPEMRADTDSPPDDWIPPMDDDWEPVFESDDNDLAPAPPMSRETRIARMDWEGLKAEARQCAACELCATRTQVVFGVGDHQAEWLVIGEAPGADEDRQGEPFVGRAGKLLNPMLLAIGLQREQVYIANILKCRPPQNREPTPAEAAQCRPFLQRQIELIQPRIILAVGRIAAQNLLETDTQIGKLRGRVHRFGASRIPLVVTYHPAYLLRSPREKRKAWDDLRLARRTLATEPLGPARRSIDP